MFVKHFFTREIVFSWPERKQRTDAKHAKQGIEDAIGGFEREIRQSPADDTLPVSWVS
jgi:hypothetical protein